MNNSREYRYLITSLIHQSPVNSPHNGQWRGALMLSLICALNKRLSKQSRGWWFDTPSRPLWRHWCWNWNISGELGQYHSCWYPGPFVSPDYQQPWHWQYDTRRSLSSTRKDFNCLCHCREEKWYAMKKKYAFFLSKKISMTYGVYIANILNKPVWGTVSEVLSPNR